MGAFVARRLRAHLLLVGSALLTVVLTVSVLAALAGFTSAVGDAGLRRALAGSEAAHTTLVVTTDLPAAGLGRADRAVRHAAAAAFDGLPVRVRSVRRSDPYALPAAPGAHPGDDPDLTVLGTLDRSRLRLVRGVWPGPTRRGAPVPVAVPAAAAARLGRAGAPVAPGTALRLTDRLGGPAVRILVTGTYRALDPGDRYWQLDPLAGKGVRRLGFTTYGPLLTDAGAFDGGAVAQNEAAWQAVASFADIRAGELNALAASVRRTGHALAGDPALGFSTQVSSDLPDLVPELRRSLLVSRSALLVGAVQLALLAAVSLLLVARLLADERESQNAVLRARGASGGRIAALAAAEAALLAVPAAVLAPLLSGPLVRLLATHGAMAETGVTLPAAVPSAAWWAAGLAAAGCALVLVLPALRSGRDRPGDRGAARRGLPALLRAGGDVALLALAGAAYWQLHHYAGGSAGSGVLAATGSGALAIDPVLVAAPALALGAGIALTLRLLPAVARIGERAAARGRSLAAALASWQFARRPLQGAGPVLLLVLAVAMGTLAIAQSAGRRGSQTDQADFAAGAPVRVVSGTGPAFGQGGAYGETPGVAAALPVVRAPVSLPGGRTGELVALDSRRAADRLTLRTGLADRPPRRLLGPLARPLTPAESGIPLPGRPQRLDLVMSADPHRGGGVRADSVEVVLEDRFGVPYAMPSAPLPVDGRPHTLSADIAAAAGAPRGAPAYPLVVAEVRMGFGLPMGHSVHQSVTVRAIRALDAQGAAARPARPPAGQRWDASIDADPGAWDTTAYVRGSARPPATSTAVPLSVDFSTGHLATAPGSRAVPAPSLRLRPHPGRAATAPLRAVATDRFLAAGGSAVGSAVRVQVAGADLNVQVTGTLREMPTTGPAAHAVSGTPDLSAGPGSGGPGQAAADRFGGALVVDLAALDRALLDQGQDPLTPGEWWVFPRGGSGAAAGRVATALRARPDVQSVLVRDELRAHLRADPLGAGPQAALFATTAVAAALAAVGFAVSAAGTLRRRLDDSAVLRALGASRRELARTTWTELGLPLVVGLGVGLLLGIVLAHLVVPLLVLTPTATRPVPPVLVGVPPLRVALLLAAVSAVPLAVTAVAGRLGGDLARRLRAPREDA